MITEPYWAYFTTRTLLLAIATEPFTRTWLIYAKPARDGRMPGKNSHESTEFKLMVQPKIGAEELVTQSSHLPLMLTVVLVSEPYFCTPLVRVSVWACAVSDKPGRAASS